MVVTAVGDWLRAAETCRLDELPRQVDQEGRSLPGDPGRRQRYAALVAAYHAGVAADRIPVLAGWWRPRADGPVEVFAGGGVLGVESVGDRATATMPAGGRGRLLGPGVLADRLKAVPYWVRLAGLTDALVLDEPPAPADELRPSLEDSLLQVSREPFAWLLVAQPVPGAELARIAQQVADEERHTRSRSSPEYAVRVARLERRHRELRQAEASGLWWVHLLAGGMSAGSATAVAGLLTASTDLTGLPYVLAPLGPAGGLDETLETVSERSPFPASSRLVAAVAAVPREEIPGLRLVLRPDFDVTPETVGTADPAGGPMVSVGRVMDRNRRPVEDLLLPGASLNRHTFVCGATGAGKSQTIRNLLEQASAAGVPWLVVEPAKAEYRRMAARLGPERVVAIRPGDPDAPPVGVNPLEPAAGFPLQTHVDLVRALFLAAFEADEPFPQVLAAALTRCYEEQGWDLALGEARASGHAPRYPTLGDLQRAADQVVTEIGYGREITDNVRGFVRVRLGSLRLGTTGRFFEGGHPLDFARLLQENVVFEIEDVGDDQDKAFLMGTVIVGLVEHLRVRERADPEPPSPGLRHLCVFEEAHRLLRRTEQPGPAAHAVELFAALLAEIRAYGEGLVVAEQIPSKLVHDVIKNTAVKVIHRLPARDDREVVGATCNLSELQSQYLVTLEPGTGAVFTDGMDRPVLIQVPDGTGRERIRVSPTRTVDDLIGRRSGLCGTECSAVPCSLRQMRNAQRSAEDSGWLTLWAELAVLGHFTGWGTPLPDRRRLRQLSTMPARLRDCTLAHAIDHAVAIRSAAAIAPVAAPPALAHHVADSMRGMRDGVRSCASEEPEWLARPYRWVLVLDELAAAVRADPGAGPHPRMDEWNARYGAHLPPVPGAGQLALVRSWFDTDTRDPTALAVVAYGAGDRSAVERAVGARRADADWNDRLEAALASFYECRWPLRYLTGPTQGGSG
jgi:DNA helicase HerA-like ATPase